MSYFFLFCKSEKNIQELYPIKVLHKKIAAREKHHTSQHYEGGENKRICLCETSLNKSRGHRMSI